MRTVKITKNVNLCFSHATIGAVTRRIHDLKPQLKAEMSANVGSWEWLIASSFVCSRAEHSHNDISQYWGGGVSSRSSYSHYVGSYCVAMFDAGLHMNKYIAYKWVCWLKVTKRKNCSLFRSRHWVSKILQEGV